MSTCSSSSTVMLPNAKILADLAEGGRLLIVRCVSPWSQNQAAPSCVSQIVLISMLIPPETLMKIGLVHGVIQVRAERGPFETQKNVPRDTSS